MSSQLYISEIDIICQEHNLFRDKEVSQDGNSQFDVIAHQIKVCLNINGIYNK